MKKYAKTFDKNLLSWGGSIGILQLYVNKKLTTKCGGVVLMLFVGCGLCLLLIDLYPKKWTPP
jgi:hypothetical protein